MNFVAEVSSSILERIALQKCNMELPLGVNHSNSGAQSHMISSTVNLVSEGWTAALATALLTESAEVVVAWTFWRLCLPKS
jgi:hypothetical protein